jgi:hypothetical protein
MNYIDITQPNQTLKFNLNYNGDLTSGDIDFTIFKDGSDEAITNFSAVNVVDFKYYQEVEIPQSDIDDLIDETQYNVIGQDIESYKIVYRGKFQTTSKDLNNLSVNEGKYIKKTTATNYTILD